MSPPSPTSHPRRSATDPTTDATPGRGAWLGIVSLAVVLAIVVGALYLILGPFPRTEPPVPPGGAASRSADPSPAPSASLPATDVPQSPPSAAASPGTTTPAPPVPSASASPSVSAAAGVPLDLDGAVLTVLPGWRLYADEVVQDERRLVRLRELTTDTRIQAVVLTSVEEDLNDACLALVADQRQGYTGVAESLAVDVQTDPTGEAVSCNFTGTRTSDSVPNKVEFTLIRRDSDGSTLFFRDTIPSAVPDDSPALAQLTAIECAAADTFGVQVIACATSPSS